jgi:putative endonuclease
MKSTSTLGQRGELIAEAFLRARGYVTVELNWHCVYGEIDIVAKDGETLVFVEVKSRRANDTEPAFESIGTRKRQRMIAAAYEYLAARSLDEADWRIDVVAVAMRHGQQPIVEHVENALDW